LTILYVAVAAVSWMGGRTRADMRAKGDVARMADDYSVSRYWISSNVKESLLDWDEVEKGEQY